MRRREALRAHFDDDALRRDAHGSEGDGARRTLAWVAVGGAAVFLAGGVASTLVGSSAASHYNGPECGVAPSATCASDRTTVHTAEAFEVVGYTAAGLAAGAAAYLFLTMPRSAPMGARETAGLWCAPAGLGAACQTRF
jgi:hypothetical protein